MKTSIKLAIGGGAAVLIAVIVFIIVRKKSTAKTAAAPAGTSKPSNSSQSMPVQGNGTGYQTIVASPYEGKMVKGSGKEVYFVQSGQKRYIPSMDILNQAKKDGIALVTISDGELQGLPTGQSF